MAPSGSNKSTPTRKVTPWPSTSANASTRKQNTARRQQTTSQATAVALTGREKQLVFACEWHFTPEAVLAVKEMFEGLNDGRVKSFYEWNIETQAWHVTCLLDKADVVSDMFLHSIQAVIKGEHLDGYNSNSEDEEGNLANWEDSDDEEHQYRSTKLVRHSVWRRLNVIKENDENVQDAIVLSGHPPMLGLEFPEKVKFYRAKTIWEYRGNQPLDSIISDQTLSAISALTGCEFVKDLNQGKIFVGGPSEEKYNRSIGKLDNIRQAAENKRNYYYRNIFYSEGVENVKFQLKTIRTIKKNFFESTLIDNLELSDLHKYENLWAAGTVRVCEPDSRAIYHQPFKATNILPATPREEVDNGSKFWINFTYNPNLPHVPNPLRHLVNGNSRTSSVAQPERSMTPTQATDLSRTLPANPATSIAGTSSGWFTEAAPVNLETRNPVQAEGNRDPVSKPAETNKPSWDTYVELDPEKLYRNRFQTPAYISKKLTEKAAAIKNVGLSRNAEVASQSSAAPQRQPPRAFPANVQARPTQSSMPMSRSTPSLVPKAALMTSKNFIDDDISSLADFSVLEPVRRASIPVPANVQPAMIDSEAAAEEDLIDFETLQQDDEVSSRVFHNTMNQRAPKNHVNPFPGRLEGPRPRPYPKTRPTPTPARTPAPVPVDVVDPLPEFLRDINVGFEEMMAGLRGSRGILQVQADFGRLLIRGVNPEFVADIGRERHYQNADRILDTIERSERNILLSKLLTTTPSDVHYLVDLKDSKGQRLWKERSEWKVLYEFFGHNESFPGYRPFSIEVGGEDFKSRIKVKSELGEINVHGTKRHWDFRLAAVGFETDDYGKNEELCGELERAIASTIYIPPGLSKPMVVFELESSMVGPGKIVIDSVRVNRISMFKSSDDKSLLKVAEIQDLDIFSAPVPDKNITVYKAIASNEYRPGCVKVNSWNEVSIQCVELNEKLKQNLDLELGDEAGWTPQSLSNLSAAQAMYLPACQMLKQMDGVGQWNDNGADSNPTFGQPPPPPPEKEVVWW